MSPGKEDAKGPGDKDTKPAQAAVCPLVPGSPSSETRPASWQELKASDG